MNKDWYDEDPLPHLLSALTSLADSTVPTNAFDPRHIAAIAAAGRQLERRRQVRWALTYGAALIVVAAAGYKLGAAW